MVIQTDAQPTQSSLSELNRARILQYLHHNGVCSRAQIAQALGLTPAAITKITAHLIDLKIIEEVGYLEGKHHRQSVGIRLNGNNKHVIAIKFARSLITIAIFNLHGNQLSSQELRVHSNEQVNQALIEVECIVQHIIESDPNVLAIGVAVPGPYIKESGRTAVVSSMKQWSQVNLLERFQASFSVPMYIEQDARAGVMAEYLLSPQHSDSNLAYYLLGEGIGLGVIQNDQLLSGALGTACEIGHISIDVNGVPCDCGNVGCLERYCCAVDLHTIITERLIPYARSMTHREACMALFDIAKTGNREAISIVNMLGRYIGFGAVTIIHLFNPARIVLGDLLAEAGGQMLLDNVKQAVKERAIGALADQTDIVLSHLTHDATVCGAASVAITQILEHCSDFFALPDQ